MPGHLAGRCGKNYVHKENQNSLKSKDFFEISFSSAAGWLAADLLTGQTLGEKEWVDQDGVMHIQCVQNKREDSS